MSELLDFSTVLLVNCVVLRIDKNKLLSLFFLGSCYIQFPRIYSKMGQMATNAFFVFRFIMVVNKLHVSGLLLFN